MTKAKKTKGKSRTGKKHVKEQPPVRGFAVCKQKGYHSWCDKTCHCGPNLEVFGDTLEEIEVHLTCEDCGAKAEGILRWGSPEDDSDDDNEGCD